LSHCPTFVLDINSDVQRVLRRLNGQPVFDADKQLVDEAADKDFSALQLGKEAFAEILARSFVTMSRQIKKEDRWSEVGPVILPW
jgi:hypothetical protein